MVLAEDLSEEVTLEMKGRRIRRKSVLGRGQRVQRPRGKKDLSIFEEEQGNRHNCSMGTTG